MRWSSLHIIRRVVPATALLAALIIPSASANAAYQSVWRSINASCRYGAKVGVSGAGTVTFSWRYRAASWQWWDSTYTQQVNFGPGMSRTVETYFGAPYSGVGVDGNLVYVSNASCR